MAQWLNYFFLCLYIVAVGCRTQRAERRDGFETQSWWDLLSAPRLVGGVCLLHVRMILCGFEKQNYSQSPAGHYTETLDCIDPSRLFANYSCLTLDCLVTVHIQYIVRLTVYSHCVVGFKQNQTALKTSLKIYWGSIELKKTSPLILLWQNCSFNSDHCVLFCFILYMLHTHSLFSRCIRPCCPEVFPRDITLWLTYFWRALSRTCSCRYCFRLPTENNFHR